MSLSIPSLPPTTRSHTTRSHPTTELLGRLHFGDRFRAFRYRDFRLNFFGQAVSAVGGWMQMVAQGWLVYALTGSPFYVGLVALARALPVFIFSLVGGTIADRVDRRLVIAMANGVAGALALTLGVLTWTNTVSIWHIVASAFFSGLAFSFSPKKTSITSVPTPLTPLSSRYRAPYTL